MSIGRKVKRCSIMMNEGRVFIVWGIDNSTQVHRFSPITFCVELTHVNVQFTDSPWPIAGEEKFFSIRRDAGAGLPEKRGVDIFVQWSCLGPSLPIPGRCIDIALAFFVV